MDTEQFLAAAFAVTLTLYVLLGGVAWANRGQFPSRLQGGGSNATPPVTEANDCN